MTDNTGHSRSVTDQPPTWAAAAYLVEATMLPIIVLNWYLLKTTQEEYLAFLLLHANSCVLTAAACAATFGVLPWACQKGRWRHRMRLFSAGVGLPVMAIALLIAANNVAVSLAK